MSDYSSIRAFVIEVERQPRQLIAPPHDLLNEAGRTANDKSPNLLDRGC